MGGGSVERERGKREKREKEERGLNPHLHFRLLRGGGPLLHLLLLILLRILLLRILLLRGPVLWGEERMSI